MLSVRQFLILIGFVLVGAIVLWLANDDSKETKLSETYNKPIEIAEKNSVESATLSDVHQITLPHDDPEFPPGPGRELFLSRCTVCHTLRYITMQPNFPEKVWAKETAKMINTFGAHISGEEARQITKYLATIKGAATK